MGASRPVSDLLFAYDKLGDEYSFGCYLDRYQSEDIDPVKFFSQFKSSNRSEFYSRAASIGCTSRDDIEVLIRAFLEDQEAHPGASVIDFFTRFLSDSTEVVEETVSSDFVIDPMSNKISVRRGDSDGQNPDTVFSLYIPEPARSILLDAVHGGGVYRGVFAMCYLHGLGKEFDETKICLEITDGHAGPWVDAYVVDGNNHVVAEQIGAPSTTIFRTYKFRLHGRIIELEVIAGAMDRRGE